MWIFEGRKKKTTNITTPARESMAEKSNLVNHWVSWDCLEEYVKILLAETLKNERKLQLQSSVEQLAGQKNPLPSSPYCLFPFGKGP